MELLVNGSSVGRKPAGEAAQNKASFDITYQPGTIEAVIYTAGREDGHTSLRTTGKAARIHLTTDRLALQAEYGSLAYVTVELQHVQ